ncbi:hypothetical protein RB195_013178 [Necator americanus]
MIQSVSCGFHHCNPNKYNTQQFHLCRRFLDPRLIPRYFFWPERVPERGAITMVEHYKKKKERLLQKNSSTSSDNSTSAYSEGKLSPQKGHSSARLSVTKKDKVVNEENKANPHYKSSSSAELKSSNLGE